MMDAAYVYIHTLYMCAWCVFVLQVPLRAHFRTSRCLSMEVVTPSTLCVPPPATDTSFGECCTIVLLSESLWSVK